MCYCQAELAEIWCINCNELFPFSFNDSWHSSVQPDTELIFQDFSKKTFTEVQFNHLQRLKCALKWSKFGKHQPLAHDRFIQKSSNICRNECVCLDATCKHLSGNSLQFYSLYNACNWLPYSCWPSPPQLFQFFIIYKLAFIPIKGRKYNMATTSKRTVNTMPQTATRRIVMLASWLLHLTA